MDQVNMASCSRCKERWFALDLKDGICHACFLRDKGNKTPFLMSSENEMDPGEVPAYLPELTQVEEMIIARSHVQMMVHRVPWPPVPLLWSLRELHAEYGQNSRHASESSFRAGYCGITALGSRRPE